MRRLGIVLAIMLLDAGLFAAEPGKPWAFDAAGLRPFWRSGTMEGESALFLKSDSDGPNAALLFEPTKVLSVRSSSGETTYQEGKDYVQKPGSKVISLPPGSTIPWRTPKDLCRPANTQAVPTTRRDGNGEIFLGNAHEYSDMQVVVRYEHKPRAWTGPAPKCAGDRLPRTLKRLTEKQPLRIALIGDSISQGYNASGWMKTPPFQPAYPDLFAKNLEAAYGAKVSLTNHALAGMTAAWGVENIEKFVKNRPDLVIIAFGMNDNPGGVSAADYQARVKAMIEQVRKARPETEFILIATMLGNADWTVMRGPLFIEYRDALSKLCGPGVALADMTSMWAELLKHKRYCDLTGNGVNHPNDFGHRVYAQVLSSLLIPERTSTGESSKP